MSKHGSSRRDFLRISAASAAALSFAREGLAQSGDATKPPAPAKPAQGAKLERRRFGKTDMEVAVLGFGGAEIGYERVEQATVDKLLNAALDAGLNVVDTAECYVDSETQIGAAIASRRKEFFLFTKCGHATEAVTAEQGWTKEGVIKSVERSLKRLKTDVVDLVQLHSCSIDELKKGAAIEGLEQAKKDGKTRYIGYSGDSAAARYAVESGRFDSLQTSLNICDQEAIELLLPLAREKQMGVIAKRPIANAVWRHDAKPPSDYHLTYWKRLQELAYPFTKGDARDAQTPDGAAGIAMRFTAMQQGLHVLIVGTSKPERWKQNAELLAAGPLSKELHDSIRDAWKKAAKSDWIGQT